MQLGLGLHIGFLRMSGRVLNSTDVIHWRILAFLGAQLQIPAPRVASLRALYLRRPTLHEHQQLAKAQLGFKKLLEPAQRQLVAHLRQTRSIDSFTVTSLHLTKKIMRRFWNRCLESAGRANRVKCPSRDVHGA